MGAWLDALLVEIPDEVRGCRHVLSGPDIVAALAKHAVTYDVLAMGTRHRTATGRLFLGSVAEGMMRHAPVPVLVMPPGGVPVSATRKANIRLPVDVNEPNMAGATWAVQNLPEAHASVVYALPWANVTGRGPGKGDSEYERAEIALAIALEAGGHQNLSRFILVGEERNAGEAVAHEAQDAGIDLTVIPTHGRTGLARLVMGSVTERLVRSSTRDVLVVR
jgi:nucleotide-binding universal stress UspA family protein